MMVLPRRPLGRVTPFTTQRFRTHRPEGALDRIGPATQIGHSDFVGGAGNPAVGGKGVKRWLMRARSHRSLDRRQTLPRHPPESLFP